MDVLLREQTGTTEFGPEYRDRELSGDVITIGSAQDQLIQLLGHEIQARHAELRSGGGGVQLKTLGGALVDVNGEEVKSATLNAGDVLTVGGHVMTFIQPPGGFAAGVELVPDPNVDTADFENAYSTSLDDTWLSKRSPSWILLAVVAILTFAIPLYLILDGDDETPDLEAQLLTDAIWTSGPLHAVHNQSIGNDCSACHTDLFEKTKDEACLVCHTNVADHVVPGHASLELNPVERCAVCHKEHNEPTLLVISADELCTDCHEDTSTLEGPSPHMQNVVGFTENDHPTFEVALPKASITQGARGLDFDWQIHETKLAGAEEASNLIFPHDLHLDVGKVRDDDGGQLACAECHQLQQDREHFVPISMEDHCRSCHELEYAPNRRLPHGLPHEAVDFIEAYNIRQVAGAPPSEARPTRERRRRAGRVSGGTQLGSTRCTTLACAAERTEDEVVSQFTYSGCVTCHKVEDTGGRDLATRFQVYPVRLSADFMPTAIFDHYSHFTQKDASGDQACLTCHSATVTDTAETLMLPNIENCLTCHSDRRDHDVVPLDCIACHSYHPLEGVIPAFKERI